jgi:DHA1 family inner membrane transport protein
VVTNTLLKTNVIGGALTSTHFTIRTAMPVLLGVLASADGFSESQLGNIGSAYSVGATLVAVTSMLWIRGLRLPVALFLLLGLGALTTAAVSTSYASILATFLVAGVGFGGVYALIIAMLSRTDDPNRSSGWQWGLGSIPGVLLLYAIPAVAAPGGGVAGTFLLVVAANAAVALSAIALPRRLSLRPSATGSTSTVRTRPEMNLPLCVGLFAVFAVYLGITGGWSFLGRIAANAGLSPKYSGAVLAAGTAASSLVALAAGQIGEFGARRGGMIAAVGAMLSGLAMIACWPSRLGFAVGTVLFTGLATFVLTFALGLIPRLDTSGRIGGLPAAALGAGSIVGPALAGHVYQADGGAAMLFACGLSLLVGLVGYAMVYREAR